MYNQPYFMPRYYGAPAMMRGAMTGNMGRAIGGMGNAMNGARMASQGARGLGLFSRLGNSMRALKGVNGGGLITNTSKTLNVVNQAIPLVRQVGPMVNNMKSMLRVASIFKDETDKKPVSTKQQNSSYSNKNTLSNSANVNRSTTKEIEEEPSNRYDYDSSPTFFVNS